MSFKCTERRWPTTNDTQALSTELLYRDLRWRFLVGDKWGYFEFLWAIETALSAVTRDEGVNRRLDRVTESNLSNREY